MRTQRTALSVLLVLAMLLSMGLSAFAEADPALEPEAPEPETEVTEIVPEAEPAAEETAEEQAVEEAAPEESAAPEGTEEGGSIAVTEHAAPVIQPEQTPEAESYAVMFVSATGSDVEGDGSREAPFATLACAAEYASYVNEPRVYVVLLSDLNCRKVARFFNKEVYLMSESVTRRITRDPEFETSYDAVRGVYNPALIECGRVTDTGMTAARLILDNVVLDDLGLHMGSVFAEQPYVGADWEANKIYVQDGIVSAYDGGAEIVLCPGTQLLNYGGMSAVYLSGDAKLSMLDASAIRDTIFLTLEEGQTPILLRGGEAEIAEEAVLVDHAFPAPEEEETAAEEPLDGEPAAEDAEAPEDELTGEPTAEDAAVPEEELTGEPAAEDAEVPEEELTGEPAAEDAEAPEDELTGEPASEDTETTEELGAEEQISSRTALPAADGNGTLGLTDGLILPDLSGAEVTVKLTSEPADLAQNPVALAYDVDYTLSLKLGDTLKTTIQAMASMVSASEGTITVKLDERLVPKLGLDGKLAYTLNSNVFKVTDTVINQPNHELSISFQLGENWSLHLDDAEAMTLGFGANLPSLYYITTPPTNVLDATADVVLKIQANSKKFDLKANTSASTRMLEAATIYLVYDPVSGSGGPAAEWVSPQSSYTLKSDPAPTHAAVNGTPVVFIGWSESRDDTIYSRDNIAPATVTAVNLEKSHLILPDRKDVYAVYGYDENGDGTADVLQDFVTLSYDANGGTGAPAAETKLTTTAFGGAKFEISSVEPTRSYYTFLGWSKDAKATKAEYKADAEHKADRDLLIHEDTTLYAVWQENPKYTLYYNANGGTGAPDALTVGSNNGYSKMTISSVTPSRSGYSFTGWSTRRSGTAAYFPGDSVQISNGNVVLYAVWQRGSGSGGSGNGYYGGGSGSYRTAPKTADENNPVLYIALGVVSLAALGGIAFALTRGKKKKNKRKTK